MTTKSQEEITLEFKEHIKKSGENYSLWVVGIAKDASSLLFTTHKVDKENGWWIYRTALSTNEALKIKQSLIEMGLINYNGNQTSEACMIYAYRKVAGTNP